MAPVSKRFKIGLAIDEVKSLLDKKVRLTPEQIRKALGIIGIGRSGIENLSELVHEYRRPTKAQ